MYPGNGKGRTGKNTGRVMGTGRAEPERIQDVTCHGNGKGRNDGMQEGNKSGHRISRKAEGWK